MNFYFCETCGKRVTDADIKAGAGKHKKFAGVYCTDCAAGVNTMETLPISDEEARRLTAAQPLAPPPPTSPGYGTKRPTSGQNVVNEGATRGSSGVRTAARTAVRPQKLAARPQVDSERSTAPRPAAGSNNKLIMLGGAGVVFLLIAVALLFGGSKPHNAATTTAQPAQPPQTTPQVAKVDEKKSVAPVTPEAPPAKPATPVAAPVKPAPADEDPREGFAQREFDKLIAREREGKVDEALKKGYEDLAASYASTKAGKAAAAQLKTLPKIEAKAAEPPKPEVASPSEQKKADGNIAVVAQVNFDNEDDLKMFKDGEWEKTDGYGGKGGCMKLKAMEGEWFRARCGIEPGKLNVTVTDDTWVKFAYKVSGTSAICLQWGFTDGGLYERFFHQLPDNKWGWCSMKLNDFGRAIIGSGKGPAVGSKFNGGVIFSGNGKPCTVYIDRITFGTGPIPDAE